jgi:hypothetical protein
MGKGESTCGSVLIPQAMLGAQRRAGAGVRQETARVRERGRAGPYDYHEGVL